MKSDIFFNPILLRQNKFPFQILVKENKSVEYFEFWMEAILLYLGKHQSLLQSFSHEKFEKELKRINTSYTATSKKTAKEVYVKKHLKEYYRKLLVDFSQCTNWIPIFHRVEYQEKKFKIQECYFRFDFSPIFTFVAKKEQTEITIQCTILIDEIAYDLEEVKRYDFLLQIGDNFYLLNKHIAELLNDLEEEENLDLPTFTENFYPRLKVYSLDISSVFQMEVREIEPKSIIQINELSGNMLLFIPKWDYEGNIVEDDKESFEIINGNQRILYPRNKIAETATLEFLRNAHPKFKGKFSFYLTFDEASKKNWFFHFYHEELKDNYQIVGMDMLGYFRYSTAVLETEFKIIKTIDNEIVAKFVNKFGKEKISLKFLQKTILEDKKFVLLKDNSLGILSEEWMSRYSMILRYARIDKEEISFAKWLLIVSENLIEHQKSLKFLLPENWLQKWEDWNKNELPIYELPKTINAKLRNYQHKGFEWLHLMSEVNAGTMLADDMGLGKTLQTIAAIATWIEENPTVKILIICPASLMYNWKMEFEKFAPTYSVHIFHGANRNFNNFLQKNENILISSYSIIRNNQEEFSKIIWDAVILDESHHIKNMQTQQTQAVLRLLAKRRVILNGTPIMNSVSDLFPQLNFLLPQLFHSQKKFKEDFENPIQKSVSEAHTEMLKKLTNPFILRRTKEIAAPDLPQKTESILWCEMRADQREAYEELKMQVKQNVLSGIDKNGLNKSKFDVLQGITKLRQMCSAPSLVKEMEDYHHCSSIKVDTVIDTLTTNLKGNKVVIFSQFLETMRILTKVFEKNNIKFLSFDGGTSPAKRIELVTEFQAENSDYQVFLISLTAGNSGINLTKANYVFLVEPWWNKAVQQQAINRVHRIGQDQPVFAYNMICKDTIEEKI